MLTKRLKLLTTILFLIFSSTACELTQEELDDLSSIIGEDQNPGTDFDHGVLPPSCFEQAYRQPEAEISKKIDLLFVVDTSGSLTSERQAIGDGVDAFLAALPEDVDANIGVSLAHVGALSGKLYRKKNDRPYVLKSSELTSDDMRSMLSYRMRYTKGEWASDGGEAMLYSMDQMLDPQNVDEAKSHGFFREEAVLVVVFVTDENDICARYPEGVTPVYDYEHLEAPAFNNYCGDVTASSVFQKLRIFSQDRPLVVSGIIYHEGSNVPNGGENEIAYGITDIIDMSGGAKIDLSGGNYHIGLGEIGSLAVKKLNLKTEFQLSSSNLDDQTLVVKVDNVEVPFSYNEESSLVMLTDYAGVENSEVYIRYCEPPEEPEEIAPVITNLLAQNITGGSVDVTWDTDILATSQVEITHVATGASVLTNKSETGYLNHNVRVNGLTPDTLYSVRAISVSALGVQTKSDPVSFRTGRGLN